MKKILKVLKGFAIIIACFFLVMTFMTNDYILEDRIAYALASCFIFAFIYIPSFRNSLLAIFFLLLSLAGLTVVFDDGVFVWIGVLMEVAFICAFLHFSRKVFSNTRFHRSCHMDMREVDNMTGLEFEHFTADLLSRLGYNRVSVTKASGDQGVDVIAYKDGLSYAVQCKHYSGKLGNSAIQEAYAGKAHYGCFYAVVFTNSFFTDGAQELAESTGVLLWDRTILQEMLLQADCSTLSPLSNNTHLSLDAEVANTLESSDDIVITSTEDFQTFLLSHALVDEIHTKIAGVSYNNDDGTSRQDILRLCCTGDEIALEYFDYKGSPAYAVHTQHGQIGNLPAGISKTIDQQYSGCVIQGTILFRTGGCDGQCFGCELLLKVYKENNSVSNFTRDTETTKQHDRPVYAANKAISSTPCPPFHVDNRFIAEAQWYAARGGDDLTEDN